VLHVFTSAMRTRSAASVIRRSVRVGILCGLMLGSAGAVATASAPRGALLQAQSRVHVLAGRASTSSARTAAADAVRHLALATFPELWINAREVDAPSYGTTVFTNSARALHDLQLLSRSVVPGAGAASKLIVGADRGLAAGAIGQAHGGDPQLLGAARSALAAGDRAASSGSLGAAIPAYTTAWKAAFQALTGVVATEATSVPASALAAAAENALGSRKIGLAGPMILSGQVPLTAAGKPELFFAGSEACPFCGVERWGMIVALSQFGTFSNLHLMQSLPTERPADRTFTFFGSSYQSPYISFAPVEVWSNVRRGFGFARLQPLTPTEQALLRQFDPPAQTPFIDVANRFIKIDSTVQPHLIAGLSWRQVASSLTHPASTSAQAIGGTAEVLTAELCEATGGNPQSVCSSPVVKQYQAALPLLNGRGGGCPPSTTASAASSTEHRSARGAQPVATTARHCSV
jgi:hypothetical protein